MIFRETDRLTQDGAQLRQEVFMEEQGFQVEFDETDQHAKHLVLYMDGKPAGVCRYFAGEEPDVYVIGRLAVSKKYRGRQLGASILKEAENRIAAHGGRKVRLSAQVRVQKFYEKCGYRAYGKHYMDEFCEHVSMEKNLSCH